MTDVVHVSFHLDRAGRPPEALLEAWPALPGCAVAAARAGVRVAVVQPAAVDALVVKDGVEFRFVRERPGLRRGPAGTRPVARGSRTLADAVARFEPALLHVQGLSLPGHARTLKQRIRGVRLLAQDHADGLPRPWRRRAARRDFADLDGVAFTAADQARPFFDAGLFPTGLPVHEVLEASIPFEPPTLDRPRPDSAGFLWLGRLDDNKDPFTVLTGFAAAAHRFPGARLRMCWLDAPRLSAVRERIERDPLLADRVELLGRRSPAEVRDLLCESDFLLQGSHREGSGYAIIEALACGVTPIVTAIPSLRAIVGDTTFLFPPGSVRGLITCLERAAASDRTRLRRAARDRFDRHLSWDAVGHQLARAYEAMLGNRPAPARAFA